MLICVTFAYCKLLWISPHGCIENRNTAAACVFKKSSCCWTMNISQWPRSNFVPNRGLGTTPPELSSYECYLSRSVCTTFAQLCSGHWHRLLNSYKARITASWQMFARTTLRWTFVPVPCMPDTTQDLWDDPDAPTDFPKLDDDSDERRGAVGYNNDNNHNFCRRCYYYYSSTASCVKPVRLAASLWTTRAGND